MITEKIELLGKGLYTDIPDTLTLKGLPTSSELDYVSGEDFDKVMLEKILPKAIEEDINPKHLLEIDYQWVCRCLRILNYGPYFTVNTIYCDQCNEAVKGEYEVNLNSIACIPVPEGFTNSIKIDKDSFIDFNKDIILKLPTIQDIQNAHNDTAFKRADGNENREMSRICYTVTAIGNETTLNPVEVKLYIEKHFSSADFKILKSMVNQLADFGLRAGGTCTCPKCHNPKAAFVALTDDRFFRPTLGNLQSWKHDRSAGKTKNTAGNKTATL